MCQKCIDAKVKTAELRAQVEAWKAEHPGHCETCLGWGSNGQPSDPSVGLFAPEPCDDCIGKGKCPRCGHQHDEDWTGEQCQDCGWTLDESLGAPESEWLFEECDDVNAKFDAWLAEREAQRQEYGYVLGVDAMLDDGFFRRADEEYDAIRERGYRRLGGY